jgi:hypothetical protein
MAELPEGQDYAAYGGGHSMQNSAGAFIRWRHLERIPD